MRALSRFQPNRQFFHSSPGLNIELWSDVSFSDRWQICAEAFRVVEHSCSDFQVHAFVMMSTHLHLLYSCKKFEDQYLMESLDQAMIGLLRKSALSLDKFIFSSCFDLPIAIEPISNFQQLLNTYRYIYRNPVEAGLSQRTEDYCYSTLPEIMGRSTRIINSVDLLHVIQNPIKVLSWLNTFQNL